jgi:hypothetical protein
MIWGLLDTKVLLFPESVDPQELEDAVSAIVSWKELLSKSFPTSYISQEATDVLANLRGFPIWGDIRDKLQRSGCEIDARDVIEVFNGLLKLTTIEEELGIVDMLAGAVTVAPQNYLTTIDALDRSFEQECLMLLCLRETNALDDSRLVLFTKDLPMSPQTFDVVGQVDLVEFSEGRKNVLPTGAAMAGKFSAINNFEHFYLCCNSEVLWRSAKSKVDIEESIRSALSPEGRTISWLLGDRFMESYENNHLQNSVHVDAILRSCREVIEDMSLQDTHKLRETAAAASRQQMRGADHAWRRDVTRDMHLHYWITDHGPELAWITVTHNDFFIPE